MAEPKNPPSRGKPPSRGNPTTQADPPSPPDPPKQTRETERAARLAASLRENLKRRKAQQRARTETSQPEPEAKPASVNNANCDQPAD